MILSGQNILITGGASGIGRLIGRLAIEKGNSASEIDRTIGLYLILRKQRRKSYVR